MLYSVENIRISLFQQKFFARQALIRKFHKNLDLVEKPAVDLFLENKNDLALLVQHVMDFVVQQLLSTWLILNLSKYLADLNTVVPCRLC